jgi:O-antigen/teichoic acid export membrane protein
MRTGTTVAINTVYLSVSATAALFVSLGFNIFLARTIGVERFGEFSFAISFITLFSVLVEFSLDSIIVRDIARNPATAGMYYGNSIALKGLFFLITFTLIAVVVAILGYPSQIRLLLHILSLGLFFDAVKKTCGSLFNAVQQMRYPATLLIAERVLFTLMGLVVINLQASIVMLGVCYVAAQAIIQLISVILVRRKLGVKPEYIKYKFCKSLAQQASSFCMISIIAAAYVDIDKLFLFSMQDATAVGIYAAVYKLVTIPTRLTNAFHKAIYPVLSKHATSPDRKLLAETYRRSMQYLMLGAFPLAIGTTVLAEPIIRVVYGQAYISGAVTLQILIWAYVLEFFNPFFSRILFCMERQSSVLSIAVMGTCLNIVLNIVLIPRYSFAGAAIATLISASLNFILLFSLMRRTFSNVSLGALALKILFASLIMGLTLVLLNDLPSFLLAFLCIVVYCGCLVMTGAFSLGDLLVFRSALHNGSLTVKRATR